MAAPDSSDAILQWQQRIGVLRHINDREIVIDEGVHQTGEGKADQQSKRRRRRARQGNPGRLLAMRTKQGNDTEQQRRQRRQDQREMSKFRNHV